MNDFVIRVEHIHSDIHGTVLVTREQLEDPFGREATMHELARAVLQATQPCLEAEAVRGT